MSSSVLRVATRRSPLALAQMRAWAEGLKALTPGLHVEEVHIVTTGDRITDRSLQAIGGKGLFLKEIEEALLAGEADVAVHSLKDVPAELAPGLLLAAIPEREDPRDALYTRDGQSLASLPRGARLGTSSLRRAVMVRRERPDLEILPLRGNVETRLRKVDEAEVHATLLAFAGLKRLGLAAKVTELLAEDRSIPACGQGALAIEARADRPEVHALVARTHHEPTARQVAFERGVMRAVEGSCQIPVAAHALPRAGGLRLVAMLAEPTGARAVWLDEPSPGFDSDDAATERGLSMGRALRARLESGA